MDKNNAQNLSKSYHCWIKLKSKVLNKKNAFIVIVQLPRKMVS